MPIFTRDETTVLSIHVPKAAGTTIENTFLTAGYDISWRRGGKYGPLNDMDKLNRCSPQHLHAPLLEEHFGDRDFTSAFCIVRHPIDRFVSEFRFRVDSQHPLADDGINTFARKALRRHAQNPFVLDNHIRPQNEFLWRDHPVYRLEQGMDQILDQISRDLPDQLPTDGVPAMRSNAHIAARLTQPVMDMLREFYWKDFETFGYE